MLEEVLTTSETKTDKATTNSKQTFRVTQVKWYENKEKDKARKEKREKARASLGVPSQPSFNHTCEDGGLWDEYGSPCEPPPPPPGEDPCPTAADGRNVAYQHGFKSDGGTWGRMDNWLRCDCYLGTRVPARTSWNERIDAQTKGSVPRSAS